MAAFHVGCRFTMQPVCRCEQGMPAHLRSPAAAAAFGETAEMLYRMWKDPASSLGVSDGVDIVLPRLQVKKKRAKQFQAVNAATKAMSGDDPLKPAGMDAKKLARAAATARTQAQLTCLKAAKLCVESRLPFDRVGPIAKAATENEITNPADEEPFDISKVEIIEAKEAKTEKAHGSPCLTCGSGENPSKMMSCGTCAYLVHKDCADPAHKRVPRDGWSCPECVICHGCNTTKAGTGVSGKWGYGYTMCDACSRLFAKGCYCTVCLKVYRDNEIRPMIECDTCNHWIHNDCDDAVTLELLEDEEATYSCKVCRGLAPKVLAPEEVGRMVRKVWAEAGDPTGGRKRKGKLPKPPGGKHKHRPPGDAGGAGDEAAALGGQAKKAEKRKEREAGTPGAGTPVGYGTGDATKRRRLDEGGGAGGSGKKSRAPPGPQEMSMDELLSAANQAPEPTTAGGRRGARDVGGGTGAGSTDPPACPGFRGTSQVTPRDLSSSAKGKLILIYWAGDHVWYGGKVTGVNREEGKLKVLYEADQVEEDVSVYPDDTGTLLWWATRA